MIVNIFNKILFDIKMQRMRKISAVLYTMHKYIIQNNVYDSEKTTACQDYCQR